MRILIVKLSSLGDVIHTMAAVQDAYDADPSLEFHWVVEKAFADLVACHPCIKKVIPIELRRWKKNPWKAFFSGEWRLFKKTLQSVAYDKVIDAQGLIKSGWIAWLARGPRYGLNKKSAREPLSSVGLTHAYEVPWSLHAVDRLRLLFSLIFKYSIDKKDLNYGLKAPLSNSNTNARREVIFFHGTTWDNKHWPLMHWKVLARVLSERGYRIVVCWGNEQEKLRAQAIASESIHSTVLDKKTLPELLVSISHASFCIAADTGLGHLAAALDIPSLTLLGPTSFNATGAKGPNQLHLMPSQMPCSPCLKRHCRIAPASKQVAPCMESISPETVIAFLEKNWSENGIYTPCK